MGCINSIDDENRVVSSKDYDDAAITLESFKFERTLGKGGFGKVNACTFQPTARWFAIKTMKKLTVLEKKGLDMLYNERNLLMKLENPWIVNAFGTFQDHWNVFLLMDLCLGGDLSYHLGLERTFSESRTKFYAGGILLALKYLHTQNVLHRDIKPGNAIHMFSNHICTQSLAVTLS